MRDGHLERTLDKNHLHNKSHCVLLAWSRARGESFIQDTHRKSPEETSIWAEYCTMF